MSRVAVSPSTYGPDVGIFEMNPDPTVSASSGLVSSSWVTLLTTAQREQYERVGYVVLRSHFSRLEVGRLLGRVGDIVEGTVPVPEGMVVMRDVMAAKGAIPVSASRSMVARLFDFHADAVLFNRYVRHSRLLDAVSALIGTDFYCIHTMIVNKPPGVDGRHPLHQDLNHFPVRPASGIVGVWTALVSTTRENGCLSVVPGSHLGRLRPHAPPPWRWVNRGYEAARNTSSVTERVHVELEPGDTILFHPLLLHGSGRNRTGKTRWAISAHFASARCRRTTWGALPPGRGPYLLMRGSARPGLGRGG